MRNLLVALLLLAVVAVVPEHAAPKPEPAEAFVGEFYDVTEIIYSGLVEPRSRLRLDSGVMNDSGVIVYPDDPVFHSDSTAGAAGEDTDRLEALFWNVGGPLIPKNKDMGISFIRFGERLMAHIVAPAAAHDRIRDVLDLLITSLRARVRVVVYEDGRLFGTASGLIGEQLSVPFQYQSYCSRYFFTTRKAIKFSTSVTRNSIRPSANAARVLGLSNS